MVFYLILMVQLSVVLIVRFVLCTCICSWEDAAKFLTGFSSVGSIAIPAILRHADLITGGAMWIEFSAFFILLSTVMIFQHVSQGDDY